MMRLSRARIRSQNTEMLLRTKGGSGISVTTLTSSTCFSRSFRSSSSKPIIFRENISIEPRPSV